MMMPGQEMRKEIIANGGYMNLKGSEITTAPQALKKLTNRKNNILSIISLTLLSLYRGWVDMSRLGGI
jgi:hypothetical protein